MRSQQQLIAAVEALEDRCFLSAAVLPSLANSYSGTFRTASSDPHFPYAASSSAATSRSRPLTLTIRSQSAEGALTGTASIGGLGNFAVSGNLTGHSVRAILSGDGSGLLTGSVSGSNVSLSGSLTDIVGAQQIAGSFTATPSTVAVTGNQTLSFVANAAGGTRAAPDFFANSSNVLTVSAIPSALFDTLPRNSTVSLNVSSENAAGLFSGTLGFSALGSFPFSGLTVGGTTTVVFSGSNVSGQIVSHPRGSTLGSGTLTADVNGTTFSGALRAAANGGSGLTGTSSTPITTTLLNSFGNTPTASAGSPTSLGSLGTTGGLAPVTSPIATPISSVLGGSAGSSGLTTTLGSGTFSNSPSTGIGLTTDTLGSSSSLSASSLSSNATLSNGVNGSLGSTSFSLSNPFATSPSGLSTVTSTPTTTGSTTVSDTFGGTTSSGLTI